MDGLNAFGLQLGPVQTFTDVLPLSAYGMEWIIPALVGTALGILLSQIGQQLQLRSWEVETL